MAKLAYFPLLIDRWIAGTHWMTVEQVGAYIRLLVWLYDNPGKYLRDEAHIARILGCRKDRASRLWNDGIGDKLPIKSKFTRFNLGFYHSLVREIHKNGGKIRGLRGGSIGGDLPTDPDPDPEEESPLTANVNDAAGYLAVEGLDLGSWERYEKYRRETKLKKLKPASVAKQQRWLAEQPDQAAVVDQTIRNGWTGLFELKTKDDKPRRGNGHSGQSWQENIDMLGAQLGLTPRPGETYEQYGNRVNAAKARAH